jgi:AbrB family looped-hinge helix DNA binding protein
MPTLKLHYDGWVALPAAARRQLGLNSGNRLDVALVDGTILLRPAAKAKRPVGHVGLEDAIDRPAPDEPGISARTDLAPTRRGPSRATPVPGWRRARFTAAEAPAWSAKGGSGTGRRATTCAHGQRRTMEAAAQGGPATACSDRPCLVPVPA